MARMLRALLRYALDKLGPRYPRFVLAAIFPLSFLVVLGGVWLLDLYVRLEPDRFWRILAVTEAAVALEIVAALAVAFRLVRPADAWLHGRRTPATALAASRAPARDRDRRLARARRTAARPHLLCPRPAGGREHRPDLDLPHDRARRPVP